MNYEVSEKKGQSRTIGLREIEDGRYEIELDGRVIQVDAAASGRMIYSIIEEGLQFEAMVDERGAHGFDVQVAGRLFHLEAVDERTRLLASAASTVASGPQTVEAEMPGKVVKISVGVGEPVSEGQGVLVLEAMKMENEIPSPIDGILREVSVSEGDTVEDGSVLFIVDPLPAAD